MVRKYLSQVLSASYTLSGKRDFVLYIRDLFQRSDGWDPGILYSSWFTRNLNYFYRILIKIFLNIFLFFTITNACLF
jgi:hypothetical protein